MKLLDSIYSEQKKCARSFKKIDLLRTVYNSVGNVLYNEENPNFLQFDVTREDLLENVNSFIISKEYDLSNSKKEVYYLNLFYEDKSLPWKIAFNKEIPIFEVEGKEITEFHDIERTLEELSIDVLLIEEVFENIENLIKENNFFYSE